MAEQGPWRGSDYLAMPKRIKDEFSALPVSKQRKYQLRKQRDGRCLLCGKPTLGAQLCLKHWVQKREMHRKYCGITKRLKGARSYRLQQASQGATTP